MFSEYNSQQKATQLSLAAVRLEPKQVLYITEYGIFFKSTKNILLNGNCNDKPLEYLSVLSSLYRRRCGLIHQQSTGLCFFVSTIA
jgi:hypothetical protein